MEQFGVMVFNFGIGDLFLYWSVLFRVIYIIVNLQLINLLGYMKNKYNIIWLECVDSTQSYLNSLDTEELSEWTIIASKSQEKGRGQGKNQWESEDNKNITFSLLLKPNYISIIDQFKITQVISLGVYDFLSKYVSNVHIKWPNDLYVGGNKICGILIQNKVCGMEYTNAICGIGLNINQTVFKYAPNPTSLKIETNLDFCINDCLNELLDCIRHRELMLIEGKSEELKDEYILNLLYYKVWAKYYYDNEYIWARILDVNEFGYLILEKKDNRKIEVELKEIKFCHHIEK